MDSGRIERAREALGTPADVLRSHGKQVKGRTARCPFHDDRSPSLSLFRSPDDGIERWRCHSCNIGGDAIDLECRLSNCTVAELLDELAPREERASSRARPVAAATATQTATKTREPMSPPDYLRARGIVDDAVVRAAKIRFEDSRVVFPWLDEGGEEVYATGRAVNGVEPRYKHTPGKRPALFATPAAWQAKRVVLVEGQFDAIAAEQAGTPAFATSASYLSDEGAEIVAQKDQVILVVDQDEGGATWRADVTEKLKGRVAIAEASLPESCKDLADVALLAVQQNRDPGEDVADVLDGAIVTFPGPYRLTPIDFEHLTLVGLPQVRYLLEPYVPQGARIWAFGPAESGKSLWALDVACELSRNAVEVAYISQENPLVEDLRRLERLKPNWRYMRFFHDQALDLAEPDHVAELVRICRRARLIVLDTLTACWSGDESKNPEIAAFDRDVLQNVVRETGASFVILDHTGNPQAFVRRAGVTAGRGASSKGQKADVVITFKSEGQTGFVIEHAKNRMGGHKRPPLHMNVVDGPDGSLTLEEVVQTTEDKISECVDRMIDLIEEAGQLNQGDLRARCTGFAGKVQTAALARLRAEENPRVVFTKERALAADGKRRQMEIWRPAESRLEDAPAEDDGVTL